MAEDVHRVRTPRPCTLTLQADGIITQALDSCPGTPREYRARQQDRFAAELLRRRHEHEASSSMYWQRDQASEPHATSEA